MLTLNFGTFTFNSVFGTWRGTGTSEKV